MCGTTTGSFLVEKCCILIFCCRAIQRDKPAQILLWAASGSGLAAQEARINRAIAVDWKKIEGVHEVRHSTSPET